MKLVEASLDWENELPTADLTDVAHTVMSGDVVVLKRVFPAAVMDACKEILLDWQASRPEGNPERLQATAHWWRRDVNPPSKTKHLFETFCFVFDGQDASLAELKPVFEKMAAIWRILAQRTESLSADGTGRMLRPQVIHYPRGGGFFDWHVHDLEPQGIGLITCMSKAGRDFESGGTRFRNSEAEIGTGAAHDIGDICLFRYDLDHAVDAVDASRPLEWGGSGRWTMVLPLM